VLATQAWNKRYLTFFPDAAFFEFIPIEEWAKWRRDPSYTPQTVLFSEVELKHRYEVVITNFYGKPLMRYRTYDIVEFVVLDDNETGIHLPQMTFVGRSPDFIDVAGFVGLLDERMVWQAIINTGIKFTEWVIRKESFEGEPIIKLYLETMDHTDSDTVQQKVHTSLKELNRDYADYENMIEKRVLEVTLLTPGSFRAYQAERMAAGADLARIKPPHMNPPDEAIHSLLKHSSAIKTEESTNGRDARK
jgi:hypothetical protein